MKILISLVSVAALSSMASANLVLNGSFENNSASGNLYNMSNGSFNSVVSDAEGFGGSGELDLINSSGYGPAPLYGNYKVALHSAGAGSQVDAFSLALSSPLVVGQSYYISFAATINNDFNGGSGQLHVGLSNSATSFGNELLYATPNIGTWTLYGYNFTATSADSYLTVSSSAYNNAWIHVDGFSITANQAVPEPMSIVAISLGGLALLRRRKRA
jgi:hypothetical protein